MRSLFVVAVTYLLTSLSGAEDVAFESIQNEFRKKTLSLVSQDDGSTKNIQAKMLKFAKETFGAHPDVVRKESQKRFRALPEFSKTFDGFNEHKNWDSLPMPDSETGMLLLMRAWDPERLAQSTKQMILSQHLGVEEFGRLAMLNTYCPDKIYKLGKGMIPDLVVESLGDLFIIKVEMTKSGAYKPVSVKWMKSNPDTIDERRDK